MQNRLNPFMLLFVIMALVMASVVHTTPVYADDGGTEPVTEESAAPSGGEETSTEEEATAQEPAPAPESPQQAPDAAEPAREEPAEVSEGTEVTEAPTEVTDTSPTQPTIEEPVIVPEVLEQLPEDTALVVVNEEGEIEPLATAEAAEIVATGDPIWCPVGATPGDAGCTDPGPGNVNYDPTSFVSLLTYLANTPAYSGSGVIWVEATYNGNDNSQIVLEGSVLTNLSGAANTLTIQGGWSGGNNTTVNPATPSTSDVSIAVFNWQGNLTIENFNIVAAGDNETFGLLVDTTGDITLNNVSVLNTPANTTDGIGDGAILLNTGNVNITGSNFSQNAGNGLLALSTGAVNITNSSFSDNNENGLIVFADGPITLNTVIANENTLTGAVLDSCDMGTPGQCTGSGAVTITGSSTAPYSNQFDHNGFNPDGSGNLADGLIVSSGGSITIDHVQANLNSVGGAALWNDSGTGNVTIDQSDFSLNPNGTGLSVFTAGDLTLTYVNALANNTGAQLFTYYGSGTTSISSSNFGTTPVTGNTATGLHVEAVGPVTLNAVTASYNGANGGYILAEGDITVNGGFFNQNGTFGMQAYSDDGDITLNDVTAAYNQVGGADLGAFWAGNIRVNNSVFVENGLYGIYAFTNEGNIELDLVTVWGSDGGVGPGADDLTDYGAILEAGGDVTVSNSTFQFNTDVGLGILSGGQVNLSNVVADSNGGNGVEVYSLTTGGPICQGDAAANITVTVDGGAFTNNGGYGLLAKPGPGGTLVFVNPATFGGNGLGDYLIDLSQDYKDCTTGPKEEKPDGKGPLIVEVPSTGGPTVGQDCDTYTGTILKLPDGTWVQIGCPFEGFSHLEEVLEENLPTPTGAGIDFLVGIDLSLTDGQGNAILNEDGTITIGFTIPEGARAGGHSILFWDPALNNGAGGWVELPPYEVGTNFPLHPDNPEDSRTVFSGVKRVGNFVTVTVDFPGTFVLVE